MKVATILPQNHLHLIQKDTYHMCLANLLYAPGMEAYTEFYEEIGVRGDTYLIMDNGVIEGDPRPIRELIVKAVSVGADEFILPDVYKDKEATLKAIDEAYEEAKACGIKMMAVPQGSTIDEWVLCAAAIICKYPEVSVIGVPKNLVEIGGRDGRIIALSHLMEACPMIRHKEIHLLGCWQTPLEILMVDKACRSGIIPMVRGVDSAIAFVYARAGMAADSDDRPNKNPIDFKGTEVNVELLKKNIKIWKKAADSRTNGEKISDAVCKKLFS